MANQPKDKAQNSRKLHFFQDNVWLLLLIGFLLLIYLLGSILSPFLVAAVLAYIFDPLVHQLSLMRIGKCSIGRTAATFTVLTGILLTIVALFLVLVPLLQKQVMLILERLPLVVDHLRGLIEPWLQSEFNISLAIDSSQIQQIVTKHWQTTGNILGNVLISAGNQGLALVGLIANLLLLPVVLFYMLRDWDVFIARIAVLIPRQWVQQSSVIAKEVDAVVAEFLRAQLSVMAVLCVFYSLGLWLAGLDMALSVGLIAGLLSFIPYFGFALAVIMALLLAMLQFTSFAQVVPVLLVFGLGQLIESFILTPLMVGERVGLHPVLVILSLLAGGQLFGFAGVLLALPVGAAIVVGLRHTKIRYLNSDTYLH